MFGISKSISATTFLVTGLFSSCLFMVESARGQQYNEAEFAPQMIRYCKSEGRNIYSGYNQCLQIELRAKNTLKSILKMRLSVKNLEEETKSVVITNQLVLMKCHLIFGYIGMRG